MFSIDVVMSTPDDPCIGSESHRSRERVRILKVMGTLETALISVGKTGQASAAAMQCLAEFGMYPDL